MVRKRNLTFSDKELLQKLISEMRISFDKRKNDMRIIMEAEYKFFVLRSTGDAIADLRGYLADTNSPYIAKSLEELYNKQDMNAAAEDIRKNYKLDMDDYESFEG